MQLPPPPLIIARDVQGYNFLVLTGPLVHCYFVSLAYANNAFYSVLCEAKSIVVSTNA